MHQATGKVNCHDLTSSHRAVLIGLMLMFIQQPLGRINGGFPNHRAQPKIKKKTSEHEDAVALLSLNIWEIWRSGKGLISNKN